MYSKGYNAADRDHQSAYATHQAAEENYKECDSKRTIKEALQCYTKAYNTDREEERAEKNLDAQEEMAKWAEGMLWAAIIIGSLTFGITVLGVIFVAKTFVATQRIAMDTREIGEAQVMAHLMPKYLRAHLTTFNVDDVDKYEISIKLNVKNVGNTPAYRVYAKAVVNKIKVDPEWIAAEPRDVAPNEDCEIKLYCDIDRPPVPNMDDADILSVYLRFDTVFTRGITKKANRVRFDYRITSGPQGKTLANRI